MSASAKKFPEIQQISKIKENVAPGERNLYYKNVGLFSDPYLDSLPKTRGDSFILQNWDTFDLPAFNETYEWMLSTWSEMKDILPTLSEAQLEEQWIKPILKKLGWEIEVQDRLVKYGKTEIPDYSLFESRKSYLKAQGCKTDESYFEHVVTVADAKKWNTPLDGSKLDKSNPSYQIVWYQKITGKEWGILTDGRYWRLYSTRSKSHFRTYYEINIEKLLVERNDDLFLYFFNFFRKDAFVKSQNSNQSFLDVVFESGEHYAKEVETRLKERAFHLVELIAQGFSAGHQNLDEPALKNIYNHSLFYLFRLIFILNLEAKGLLNIGRQSDYYAYSLRSLCLNVKSEFESNATWARSPRSYNHVMELFNLLMKGDESIGLHGFGKEPFESGDKSFFDKHPIPDSHLNKVLLELAFATDKKEKALRLIDYKRLSADHLGSLFEGLLEYRLEVPEKKNSNEPILVNSSGVRKQSGSFYTPEYIVDFIVEKALSPLIKDKNAEEILKLKVVDPAMGSGHFLLGVVRFLENAILTSLSVQKIQKISPHMVSWEVLHSCIHGTDINPLAVELSKYSLWMYTAQPGFELEPLMDQLKVGDSLVDDLSGYKFNFDWKSEYAGIFKDGGFDAIVGNPPYLFSAAGKDTKDYFSKNYTLSQYQTDFYTYFMERSLQLGKPLAKFSFIVSDSWLNSPSFSKLRNHFLEKHKVDLIAVFDFPVFKDAAIENSIFVLSLQGKPSAIPIISFSTPEQFSTVNEILPKEAISAGMINPHHSDSSEKILKKIETGSESLKSKLKVNRGMHAYRTDGYGKSKFGSGPQTKRDKEERSYHAKKALNKTYLPEIRGKDVERFSFKENGDYVSYGDWLAEPRQPEFFLKPKVVVRKILGEKLHGTFIKPPLAIDQSLYILISNSDDVNQLKYTLGVLSSRLGAWYLRTKYAIYDSLYPWYTTKQLAEFPLKSKDARIVELVNELLSLNETESESTRAEIIKLEKKLDHAVYSLYGLSESDISAIESELSKKEPKAKASKNKTLKNAA